MFWLIFNVIFVIPLIILCSICMGIFVIMPGTLMLVMKFLGAKEHKRVRRSHEGANVAFFHPYCNAGGGGERVLWVAVKALLIRYPDTNIYIYTVESADAKAILSKTQNQFNVELSPEKITFVRLKQRRAIESTTYPYFTLAMQSLGSMLLGMEAFMKLNPDVYIDTTGFAFTYPIFRYLAQCPVGCYVHYPTITSAMMRRVKHRIVGYNNSSTIAGNPVFTGLKLAYYKIFGMFYSLAGRCANVVMVNGSWTEEHINELWNVPFSTHKVFPPCDVAELKKLCSLADENQEIGIISVGQFRPEKDHPLMLQAMYEVRNLLMNNENLWNKIKLILVGSCRNPEDEDRVQNLKDLSKHLSIEENVKFVVNASYPELLKLYQTSMIGLHAMWNEHFGISVVECMAAGLVVIGHRSGGPRADIICEEPQARSGFLASDPQEYARTILEVIALSSQERDDIINTARASVDRFSEKEFQKTFLRAVETLMKT